MLSLVAHAIGYKMIVGTHNIVDVIVRCMWEVVSSSSVWQMSVPATLSIPRGMQGVLPCSSGTVNVGTHNTVDAQRHVGEPYRMGVNGAHNTVGKMSAPTTLFVPGRL